MPSHYWIKLYHEILDDPKMGRLPDHLWRRVVEMFLLAGDYHDEAFLPPVGDMAWRLRCSEEELLADLTALAEIDILEERDGRWYVTHFSERQAAVPDTERSRRYREAKRKRQYYGHYSVTSRDEERHETVTSRDVDTDTDTDTEAEPKANRAKTRESAAATGLDPPNVYRHYENNIGIITAHMSELLRHAEGDYPADWIVQAIDIGVENNARNWRYCQTILERWKSEGKDDGRGRQEAIEKRETQAAEDKLEREIDAWQIMANARERKLDQLEQEAKNAGKSDDTPI